MRYTENGLQLSLAELEDILKKAKCHAIYDNMEGTLYFKGKSIRQFSSYQECNSVEYVK